MQHKPISLACPFGCSPAPICEGGSEDGELCSALHMSKVEKCVARYPLLEKIFCNKVLLAKTQRSHKVKKKKSYNKFVK